MPKEEFDFYDKTSLKSYNLDKSMQYQLNILGSLDVFTRKHSENVASIVCRICKYLHLSKDFTEYCTICAYLHDIGKQFIPPAILEKPSALTPEEFEDKMSSFKSNLEKLFSEGKSLEDEIKERLEELNYV